jgi:hypothetical protein
MDLEQLDHRQLALGLARARAVNGLIMLILPGLVGRSLFGKEHSGAVVRALVRLLGIRDLVLAIGAINTLKERTMDAEWVAMGAVADGVDAVVALVAPGLPRRTRMVVLAGGSAAVTGFMAAKALDDERRTPEVSEINP